MKVFGCEKHEEDVDVDGDDNSDRLSPVIKEEEVGGPRLILGIADRCCSLVLATTGIVEHSGR